MGPGQSLNEAGAGMPPRVVFDTNVVISTLVFGGRLAWLPPAWAAGVVVPLVCRETVTELLRVLAYPKFRLTEAERSDLLQDYLPFAEVVVLPDPRPAVPVACRDRDDVVFIELAISASADALVSGDDDLASLDEAGVPIFTVESLRRWLDPPEKPPRG